MDVCLVLLGLSLSSLGQNAADNGTTLGTASFSSIHMYMYAYVYNRMDLGSAIIKYNS